MGKKTHKTSIEKLAKECEKGNAESCGTLGFLYTQGDAVQQDDFQAVKYFKKACDLGDGLGCNNLGFAYQQGNGVKQDLFKAAQYYQKSCDFEEGRGCLNLALVLKTGIEPNERLSTECYKMACGFGDEVACLKLGEKFESEKDIQEAQGYYGKACELKSQDGCSNYARLNNLK